MYPLESPFNCTGINRHTMNNLTIRLSGVLKRNNTTRSHLLGIHRPQVQSRPTNQHKDQNSHTSQSAECRRTTKPPQSKSSSAFEPIRTNSYCRPIKPLQFESAKSVRCTDVLRERFEFYDFFQYLRKLLHS